MEQWRGVDHPHPGSAAEQHEEGSIIPGELARPAACGDWHSPRPRRAMHDEVGGWDEPGHPPGSLHVGVRSPRVLLGVLPGEVARGAQHLDDRAIFALDAPAARRRRKRTF